MIVNRCSCVADDGKALDNMVASVSITLSRRGLNSRDKEQRVDIEALYTPGQTNHIASSVDFIPVGAGEHIDDGDDDDDDEGAVGMVMEAEAEAGGAGRAPRPRVHALALGSGHYEIKAVYVERRETMHGLPQNKKKVLFYLVFIKAFDQITEMPCIRIPGRAGGGVRLIRCGPGSTSGVYLCRRDAREV